MQNGSGLSGVEAAKQVAGRAAAQLVQDGMLVGLGTGSTVRYLVDALGERVAAGLRFTGVPTSEATARQATSLGIQLADPDAALDLAIDGADEVERGTLRLIKGLGGALLREKIVAQLAARFVVVADASKVVTTLGERSVLPVEVVRFGLAATTRRIAGLGATPTLRRGADGATFVTDGGNYVLDCAGLAPIRDPFTLQREFKAIAGVVETGLFLEIATEALVAQADGTVTKLLVVGAS
jgi:ribose 5-phosphate isomerase A